MELNNKIYLLRLARLEIASELGLDWSNYSNAEKTNPSQELKKNNGTFVTLTVDENLRGCIGQIQTTQSLERTVKDNAYSSAFRDSRFTPLTKKEFNLVNIEISILSETVKLQYTDAEDLLNKIKKGIHGLIIHKGSRSATFLPQVWEDIATKQEFLQHLCMKAGLNYDEWKKNTLDVYTYTVEHFNEKELGLKL